MNYKKIKGTITARLSEMGISTQKMSTDLGFTPQGYRKWFVKENIRVNTVLDIAEYLKLDPKTLLFGNQEAGVTNLNEGNVPYTTKKQLEHRVMELEGQMKEVLIKLAVKE